MKKKFAIITITFVFIFVMFTPFIPTVFLNNRINCTISPCGRYIISIYELILDLNELQQPPRFQ